MIFSIILLVKYSLVFDLLKMRFLYLLNYYYYFFFNDDIFIRAIIFGDNNDSVANVNILICLKIIYCI